MNVLALSNKMVSRNGGGGGRTPEQRRAYGAQKKARQRSSKKNGGGETVMVKVDDPGTWREILTLKGISKTMSLGAATAQIVFDMCRDHRKALAEEAWAAIGEISVGYLEMMEPPASFEPILIKPRPIPQVSFSEMDDEQRELAENADEAQFMEDLTEKLEKLEDDGGWAKPEEGGQRALLGIVFH